MCKLSIPSAVLSEISFNLANISSSYEENNLAFLSVNGVVSIYS